MNYRKKEESGREARRLTSSLAGEMGAVKKFLALRTGADSSRLSAQPGGVTDEEEEEEEEEEGWEEG